MYQTQQKTKNVELQQSSIVSPKTPRQSQKVIQKPKTPQIQKKKKKVSGSQTPRIGVQRKRESKEKIQNFAQLSEIQLNLKEPQILKTQETEATENLQAINLDLNQHLESSEKQAQGKADTLQTEFSNKYFDAVYLDICGISVQTKHQNEEQSNKNTETCSQAPLISESEPEIQSEICKGIKPYIKKSSKKRIERQSNEFTVLNSQVQLFDSIEKEQESISQKVLKKTPKKLSPKKSAKKSPKRSPQKQFEKAESNQEQELSLDYLEKKRIQEQLREENRKMVEEFNICLKSLKSARVHDNFYKTLQTFDYKREEEREKSPTKRLIEMRETPLIEHATPTKNEKVYIKTPEKAYLVEKESEKEIQKGLKLAKKNPLKFLEKEVKKEKKVTEITLEKKKKTGEKVVKVKTYRTRRESEVRKALKR